MRLTKAASKARSVLDDCGLLDEPLGLSCEDIALARGVTAIQAIKIDGSQGRIMIDKNDAIISYNKGITHEGKKRFIIAHELGHFELHKDLFNEKIHTDDNKSLSEWFSKGEHEREANEFAAELLMPSHLFINEAKGKPFNFSLIKNIATKFQSSITSSLLRYRVLGDYPIAIVYSDRGRIKWSSFSDDFCLKFIRNGSGVPYNSVAKDFYNGDKLPDEPELIDNTEWFSEDFNVDKYEDINFYEQCIQIGRTGVISCIWND